MTRTLQLIFSNQENRNVTISVSEARADLTEVEVETVMNHILSRNIFTSSGGELVKGVRAQVVSREVETLVEF